MRFSSRHLFFVLAVAALLGASSAVALGDGSVLEASRDWGPSSPSGLAEQVSVNGDWAIRVAEDGRIVDTFRFTNHLTEAGADTLARLLSGEEVAGAWSIGLSGSGVCAASSEDCTIRTPIDDPADTGSDDLVVEVSDGRVRLDGSLVLGEDVYIDSVRTHQFACPAQVGAVMCRTHPSLSSATTVSSSSFTSTDVQPVALRAGQRLLVTVVIGFD